MTVQTGTARIVFTVVIFLSLAAHAPEHAHDGLLDLKGHPQRVFYSPGHETRAEQIATQCDRATTYFNEVLGSKPTTSLFILGPDEWSEYGTFPVYGMPHYPNSAQLPEAQGDRDRLVIAAEDNDFWRSFVPSLEQLPPAMAEDVRSAYTSGSGELSMMPFFDLLALHELGHGFHFQAGLNMQRFWMQELLANMMLHTYVAENEPEALPALETLPEMVVRAGSAEYEHTSLADFERLYTGMDAKNYGWYQSRLHVAAKQIYEAGGKEVVSRLWDALKNNEEDLSDAQLIELLETEVHQSVADVVLKW